MENHLDVNSKFGPYELEVKLKELGFDEQCLAVYINNKLTIEDDWLYSTNKDTFIESTNCTAPLWQQAFDWFREKYELHSCILVLSKLKWAYVITNFTDYVDSDTQILKSFETYEEARQACLEKLIEICQQN